MGLRGFSVVALGALVVAWASLAFAEPVPRPVPVSGTVVTAKGGEEILFVTEPDWRLVEIRQDLLGGDALRTNAIGTLAILFADRTQIRVGRNTRLVVKEVRTDGTAQFSLPFGTVWARAEPGGTAVVIDTPAAAAAVRGTDWTLNVAEDGRTALAVMEGLVELSNEFGSVSVGAGEAAVATIGSAPAKIILVSPPDREQMLYYFELRPYMRLLPATPFGSRERREASRLLNAIPAGQRSTEDWLTLAEVSLILDGRSAAVEALAVVRSRPLTADQQARADLVEALLAASEKRWNEASALFARALPRLEGRRQVTGIYGAYIARAMADPRLDEPLPAAGADAFAYMAQALIEGFRYGAGRALEILREGEARFPHEPMLPAARARFAILLDETAEARDAVARAIALDPNDPAVLLARAYFRADVEYDLDGALADLTRAAATAPGDTDVWNALGLVQFERNAMREAEAAFLRGIEADPYDPLPHANYAIFLLEQHRMQAARREVERTLALDPSFHFAHLALGRYHLQRGEMDEAVASILASSVANPAQAEPLLALAIAYYESGDTELTLRQLDTADRLDPNNPVIPNVRTIIALDRYEADQAIRSARESVKRMRERGIYTSPLSSSRESGSFLGDAFRFLRLNAWARYYSEAVFDPFVATGYFDQAINGTVDPYANFAEFAAAPEEATLGSTAISSLLQGLLLDPLAVSGRNRRTDLIRRPFLDTSAAGGFSLRDGEWEPSGAVEIQGFDNRVIPVSFYLTGDYAAFDGGRVNDEFEEWAGIGFLGAQPTPYDRVIMFSSFGEASTPLPGPVDDPTPFDEDDRRFAQVVGGWSHTLADRNVLSAAAAYVRIWDDAEVFRAFTPPRFDLEADQATTVAAINHLYGIGPFTLRYGGEGSWTESATTLTNAGSISDDLEILEGRAYADVLAEIGGRLQFEAGAAGFWFDAESGEVLSSIESEAEGRFLPRIGAAVMPLENHWLRAAWMETTQLPVPLTLSPVATVGLTPNEAPVDFAGEVETLALRWDAEWNAHLFTALEYQRQDMTDISLGIANTLDSFDVAEGRIDRLSASANLWLGGGLGAFASFAWADSESRETEPSFGEELPFVPETLTRIGLTWAHPSRVKLALTQTLVGPRAGNKRGKQLDDFALTDATLNWEPLDRRFALDVGVFNIFDEEFEVASKIPGWRRTVTARFTTRF